MTKKRSFGNFFLKKIDIFCQFAWKNQNFSSICLEKSKSFPLNNQIFLPGSTTPQISNQMYVVLNNTSAGKMLHTGNFLRTQALKI